MKSNPISAFLSRVFGTQFSPILATLTIAALVLSLFGFLAAANPFTAAAAPDWDVTGSYVVSFDGYEHDATLAQNDMGEVTGSGGYPAGETQTFSWVITDGEVDGDTINLTMDYTFGATGTTMHMTGTIAEDGSMSGTWDDNYGGEERNGTWETVSGEASALLGTLAAEDFGVVSYDTGLGMLRGYSAGFGLTDATFEDAQSVVVQLFNGATLLQTNTGTAKIGDEITGNQISSPFDVSGDFDYETDGFWVNDRESEYGQSVPATRVVATVVLANGKEVTAENTNLTGDPSTIYPTTTPTTHTVTINKFVEGAPATGSSADFASFTMNATWDAENIGAGSGQYALGASNTVPYQAMTAEMTAGADYSTSEVMNSTVAAACATGTPFALVGYTTGDSYAAAASGTPTTTAPSFTDIQSDKYVIVWNDDCSLPVEPSNGNLSVDSIETIDGNATDNGSFADGWEYAFNLTVPTDEPNIAMKFSNWLQNGGGDSIPVANNMRISSAQANNGGATILLTAADTYSSPELHMVTDLNPSLPGLQVRVIVEVAIPEGTDNGSYTTNYGVRSTPVSN
jgi:hypothetical protein